MKTNVMRTSGTDFRPESADDTETQEIHPLYQTLRSLGAWMRMMSMRADEEELSGGKYIIRYPSPPSNMAITDKSKQEG